MDNLDTVYIKHFFAHYCKSRGQSECIFDECMSLDWTILLSIGEMYSYNALECPLVGTGANATWCHLQK